MTTSLHYPGLTGLQNRSNLVKYLVFQYKIGIESHQNPVKFQSFVARETSKLQIIVLEQF